MELVVASTSAVGLFIVAAFVLHVAVSTYLLRVEPPTLQSGQPEDFEWHIFVPALNEEAVLNASLAQLCAFSQRPYVWVIDDASDDATAAIALDWARRTDRVRLVSRQLPSARSGKGSALNEAYRQLTAWRNAQSDPTPAMRVIVGVVDADGVLDPNTFNVLSGAHCFDDPAVGAVQQDVWMSNAHTLAPDPTASSWRNHLRATMVRLQDIEFRASIAAIQHARHLTSSVSMGGNGQWTRLEALDDIVRLDVEFGRDGERGPWHGALLEDFELGVHLLLTGWVTKFTPGCYVAQEALPSLRAYIRQRTRWCQGSMQCGRYLPHLWRSAYVGPWALLECAYYLAQPWLWIVGTVIFPLPFLDAVRSFARDPADWWSWFLHDAGWMWLTMVIALAVGPLGSWSFTYRRVRAKAEGEPTRLLRTMHDAFAYVLLVNLSYVIAWRSLVRVLRRRTGWLKTERVTQSAQPSTSLALEVLGDD